MSVRQQLGHPGVMSGESGIMSASFDRFGGISAIVVGVLSVLYAIFYLLIARQAEYTGLLGSWLILAASGLFSSAAYVALYLRLHRTNEGYALWALLLGIAASFVTLLHGVHEALLLTTPLDEAAVGIAQALPSEVDPSGLATFFIVGIVVFIFSRLVIDDAQLPKRLGQLGIANGVLLVVLFFASAFALQNLILLSGGLTSLIVGPIWWIWLGSRLLKLAQD